MNSHIEKILKLLKTHDKNEPFILGIDGLSGAGKSTFALSLKSELSLNGIEGLLIHIDDHIVQRSKRYATSYEEWYEYYFLQWDIEKLTEKLFLSIKEKVTSINLPFYDKTHDRIQHKILPICNYNLILIEGVFLQRTEWRQYFDYVIYLNCDKETRYDRVRKRDSYLGVEMDIIEKYKRRYWKGEEYYLKNENPISKANLVIDVNQVIN
ncbi:AAA family ATPase [Bacillus sp. RG28]|uniref:AAA family ATPase n=1 Tax=Gottfriedia endophytica TaxID=2820819 RepID=A0A940SKM4_9BACI|nr:kinase [Gottfriedia endophytica]MBP0726601.1 AAA family ATPase [Gottfriedia endophytica]